MLSVVQSGSPMPRPDILQMMLSAWAAVSIPRFQSAKYWGLRSVGNPAWSMTIFVFGNFAARSRSFSMSCHCAAMLATRPYFSSRAYPRWKSGAVR